MSMRISYFSHTSSLIFEGDEMKINLNYGGKVGLDDPVLKPMCYHPCNGTGPYPITISSYLIIFHTRLDEYIY